MLRVERLNGQRGIFPLTAIFDRDVVYTANSRGENRSTETDELGGKAVDADSSSCFVYVPRHGK